MKDYDKNKESSHLQTGMEIIYMFWKMSQKLPVNNFESIILNTSQFNEDFIKNYN